MSSTWVDHTAFLYELSLKRTNSLQSVHSFWEGRISCAQCPYVVQRLCPLVVGPCHIPFHGIREVVESPSPEVFKKCGDEALSNIIGPLSLGQGGDELIVGLDSLTSLFQRQWFYDSMIISAAYLGQISWLNRWKLTEQLKQNKKATVKMWEQLFMQLMIGCSVQACREW